ncbi:MBL fold metallo-hydrolase [Kozakia baliensis]|uniref:MBL fold metallo-hydrolase n=1 Tax=Kozakia baliensis TaxID=153496 RepID=UPI00049611BC|nr:MBL fold metallo-hydrolase [Kozakia baliensis]
MKIIVLGCGGSGGVPMVGGLHGEGIWGDCDPNETRNVRTRSSIVIEGEDGRRLLVDSGPDLRTQLLRERLAHIHAVLYTHEHSDHIAGLDELRAINRVIDAPLPLYATQTVMNELEARFAYAFRPWTGPSFYRPVLETHPVETYDAISPAGLDIRIFEQRHGRIPSLGLRCGKFGYSTDVEFLSDASLAILDGVECWMVDCFQYGPHVAHAWLDQVLEWRERLRPARVILTHMGPEMDYTTLRETLPEGVEPAFDGMTIVID